MEYHSDRFEDYSLMVFKDEKLIAVLPANIFNNELHSHQGLTYGGLVLSQKINLAQVKVIFKHICDFLKINGVAFLTIKQVPEIYHKLPAFEMDYFLKQQSNLIHQNLILALDYSNKLTIHKKKLKNFIKAEKYSFKIIKSKTFDTFWNVVLEPRLLQKYKSKPVHSLEEIKYLHSKFPKNIKQFNLFLGDEILAGITIFEEENTVKSQYGATTSLGEKHRALDYLFLYLINKYKDEGKKFFSMGTINNKSFLGYNEGLLKQKQELGCHVYLQNVYKIELS